MPKLVNVNKKSAKGAAAAGKGATSGKDSPLPEEMDVDLESLGSCDPLDPAKNPGEDKDKLIDRWLDGKKGDKSEGGDGGEKGARKKRKWGAKSDEDISDSGGKRADGDGQLKLPAKSKKQKSAQPPTEQMSAEQMQALTLQTMGMQAMGMNPALMTMRGLHLPRPDPDMISQMQGMDPLNMMEKSRECLMQATQSRAPNPTGFHCRVVMLGLPPGIGTKLGLVMEDSKEFIGMPELKQVLPSSPVITQIPPEFRQGCCVASLRSDKIGHATPKTAKEAVELINKSRFFGMQNLIRLEMLLIQTKVTTAPQPNPELRNMRLQASRAAMAPGLLPSQPQVSRPVETGGPLREVERRSSPRKLQQTTSYNNYKDWNLHYEALVEYTHLYGNCDVRASTHPVLAQWCLGQRASAHKLTKSRQERLEKVGFWALPANPKQSRAPSKPSEPRGPFPEPTWDERYDSLVRFKDKCGLVPTSGSLFEWIETQKKEAERLSQTQCVKLYGAGVDLGLPRERLEQMGIEVAEDEEGANAGGVHWWQSPEARNLFGSEWGEHVHVVTMLQERVALLRKANESVAGWKSLVPEDGKVELYNENDILTLRHKAQYLSRAYLLAIEKMPIMKWSNCCAAASKELMALGLSKAGETSFAGGTLVSALKSSSLTLAG